LDELVPEPPLFPTEPKSRAQVEAAERFADEVLQPATRRIVIWSAAHDPDSVRPYPAIGRMPIPRNRWIRARVMGPTYRLYGMDAEVVHDDLEALPATLDTLDGYVTSGTLNSEALSAADFQTAPLIAGLLRLADLRAEIVERPVAALAERLLPGSGSWKGPSRTKKRRCR
jgi:glutathione S-transferase